MNNEVDFSDLYFLFKYKMDTSTISDPAERYLNHYKLEIWLDNEDESQHKLVGKGDLYNILLGAAINDEMDEFQIFDWTESLTDLGNEIYDFEENDFCEAVSDYYDGEFYNPNVFFINRLELLPAYRGHCLGKKIIKDIYHRFSSACGLFVLKAFPLQKAIRDKNLSDWDELMKFHRLEQDEEKATYKMYSYYQSLGFTNILKNDYFFFNPAFNNEQLDDISFDNY